MDDSIEINKDGLEILKAKGFNLELNFYFGGAKHTLFHSTCATRRASRPHLPFTFSIALHDINNLPPLATTNYSHGWGRGQRCGGRSIE